MRMLWLKLLCLSLFWVLWEGKILRVCGNVPFMQSYGVCGWREMLDRNQFTRRIVVGWVAFLSTLHFMLCYIWVNFLS